LNWDGHSLLATKHSVQIQTFLGVIIIITLKAIFDPVLFSLAAQVRNAQLVAFGTNDPTRLASILATGKRVKSASPERVFVDNVC
jgi:hypothetical protein